MSLTLLYLLRLHWLPDDNQGNIHAVHGTYPSTEIAEKANEIDAMLIVMALRQRYGFFE